MQIDCDIHPGTPNTAALFPYMPEHWRDMSQMRGIEDLHSSNYPDLTPLAARPAWRPAKGRPGTSAATVSSQCLEPFGTDMVTSPICVGTRTRPPRTASESDIGSCFFNNCDATGSLSHPLRSLPTSQKILDP